MTRTVRKTAETLIGGMFVHKSEIFEKRRDIQTVVWEICSVPDFFFSLHHFEFVILTLTL